MSMRPDGSNGANADGGDSLGRLIDRFEDAWERGLAPRLMPHRQLHAGARAGQAEDRLELWVGERRPVCAERIDRI